MMTYREFIEQTMMCGDTLATVEGVPPLSLPKSKGKALKDYRVYGQSQQNGTPTPESPVAVESVGNAIVFPNQLFNISRKSSATSIYGCTMTPDVTTGRIHLTGTGTVNDFANYSGLVEWLSGSEFVAGHIYYMDMKGLPNLGNNTPITFRFDGAVRRNITQPVIFTRGSLGNSTFSWFVFKDMVYDYWFAPQIIDLTIAYGAGNEPSTISEFKAKLGLSDNDEIPYIPYSTTEITKYRIPLSISNNPAFANLPQEYQQVEYLESHGTEYIDTGINVGTIPNFNLDLDFSSLLEPDVADAGVVFICRNNWDFNSYCLFYRKNESGWRFHGKGQIVADFSANTRYRYTTNCSNNTGTLSLYDGTEYTHSLGNNSNLTNLNLFGFNRYSYRINIRIYGLKCYNETTLIGNFIPARRKSDSVLGMYDLVTNTFFTNQGTGTFTCGADINGTTTNIYLNAPLRKIGNYADYIDFKQRLRHTEVSEDADSSEKPIAEGLHPVIPPTEESITLPSVPTMRGQCYFKVLTDIQPSNSQVKYLK